MRLHRTSLAHAQDVVARLLEAMIDAAPNLSLPEVEGDAAFLYTWTRVGRETSTVRTGVDQMVAMHRAFHACQQHIIALNTCRCEGCRQAGRLRVKFVVHLGDVAVQRVKHSAKLAGLDVILVHRMLKNAVPTYFMDVTEIASEAPLEPKVTAAGRFRENFGVVIRSLPYLLGLKRSL